MKSFRKKIKEILLDVVKKNLQLRGIIRFLMGLYRLVRYKMETLFSSTNDKMILLCCFQGRGYNCSPKAIYEYMIKDERFSDYTFVWAFKQYDKHLPMFEEFDNTIVVKYGSKEYRKYLAKSKYWVINYKIDDYLKPKKNQVLIQCWHGTPLKKLGFDLTHFDNVLNTMEGMQHRYALESKKIDCFLSPSAYATQRIISAWGFDKINKENVVIQEGYPRNDFLLRYSEKDVERVKKELFEYYFIPYEKEIKKKKIILYAPTYRSDQHETGTGYVYNLQVDFDYLQDKLGDDYIILLRTHYFIANKYDLSKYDGFVYDVSEVEDINDLYIISDILITDYSSVLFDYAILKRPMVFYMYDLEHYRDESNGFYFDVEDELPGPIVKTQKDLVDAVLKASNDFVYDEKYALFNKKYNYLDDGNSTQRVVEKIFGSNS